MLDSPPIPSPRSTENLLPLAVESAVCGLIMMAWFAVSRRWDGGYDPTMYVLGLLAVVMPFGMGQSLLSLCNAWLGKESRRCRRVRHGLFRRCSDHLRQPVTIYDMAGGVCLLVGTADLVVFVSRFSWSAFMTGLAPYLGR